MFPGLGGLSPKKMQAMMKQLGIKQEDIDAERVIIEKEDGGKIIIKNPSVAKVVMQGKESFQISGDVTETGGEAEEGNENTKEEDIKMIMEKTGKSRKKAEKALEEADDDIAQAIMKLSKE